MQFESFIGLAIMVYSTNIPLALDEYEMIDSQLGATVAPRWLSIISYPSALME